MPPFDEAEKTPEQHAGEAVVTSKSTINAVVRGFVESYKREFNIFWRNPNSTPHQMADAWGTTALDMFQKSALTRAYLLAIDSTSLNDPQDDYINTPLPVTPEIVDGAPTGRMIVGSL